MRALGVFLCSCGWIQCYFTAISFSCFAIVILFCLNRAIRLCQLDTTVFIAGLLPAFISKFHVVLGCLRRAGRPATARKKSAS